MTYTVSGGTLNPTHSLTHSDCYSVYLPREDMKGWVDLGVGYAPRWLMSFRRESLMRVVTTRPEVEPTI